MTDKIKVLLADSEQVFREGLARLLQDSDQFEVIYQCHSGNDTVQKAAHIKPNVVLIDSEISDCGLIETVRQIVKSSPEVKVVVITRSYQQKDPFEAIDAGARGILAKNISTDDLVRSLELIASGRVVISPHFSDQFLDEVTTLRKKKKEHSLSDLPISQREIEILKLVCTGATTREIADDLVISENTVKAHIRNMARKLGLRNRQQLVAYAITQGLTAQ